MPLRPTPKFDPPLLHRLRRSAIVLFAAGIVLAALAAFGPLSLVAALFAFAFIAAVALIEWRWHDVHVPMVRGTDQNLNHAVVQAIVAGMPDAAVLLDRSGRVLHFNTLAVQLAPALRRGEPAQFALRSPEIVEALREAVKNAAPSRVTFLDQLPVNRWLELIVTPVPIPTALGGTDHYILMTFHDLTPLRRVEEMRADFVANASHELRTPLAAVTGFIDTLLGPAKDDPKARERFLGIMRAQATRMARLIDDLLSLSRVELRTHLRPDTPVDLVPIIRHVTDGLEPLAKERAVAIELTLPETPAVILGDREEVIRVVENLVENGLKYGSTGDRLMVTLSEGVGVSGTAEWRIAVRDFGPGIAPEHLPRLTERFYRINDGDSRAQGGTGLGLSLVKHILNRHQGRLMIESVLGKGATFTACFPQTNNGR
ncbi:MAG TPA: ATP-binding protein [Xanthobacteraceae bacterium]|nr:ATP-binding protein [Xanthobacteraceae bacterium]